MAISIENYRSVAQAASRAETANESLYLSKSGDSLVLGDKSFQGKMASWSKSDTVAQHTKVRRDFVQSLASHYGKFIAEGVAETSNLNGAAHIKKPLTAYEVSSALKDTDERCGEINSFNKMKASSYVDKTGGSTLARGGLISRGNTRTSRVVDQMLTEHSGANKERSIGKFSEADVNKKLRAADVPQKIQSEILKKGDNGRHLVSDEEADGIAKQVILQALSFEHKETEV